MWDGAGGASDPGDVASFSATVAGNYSVVVSDEQDKSSWRVGPGSGTLTVNPNPTVTVNSPVVCASALPATLTASPSGGAGPYHYVWTVPAGASDPGDVASFSATVAGNYSVVVSDSSSPSCASVPGSGTLTVNPNPTVTVNSPVVCASALPATLTASPSGGAGPYHYVWTVPAGASDPGDVASFSATVAGNYSVVVSDSSSPSCASAPGAGR